ncbi:two-component regulator propeller domain-containing protein [Colwelliaceae bacterium 6471]
MSYKFVRTIAQDDDGFMWFGSSEGLDRFDGYKLVSFHHDSEAPSSLSSNVIGKILVDSQQNLWIGTRGGGLNLFQEDSQDFLHFTTKSNNTTLTNDTVNALLEDSNGNLWVGTDNGLNVLINGAESRSVKQITQELGNPNSLTHNTVYSLIETKNREIWVGTNGGGISVFDLNGNFIRAIKYQDTNSSTYINKFINSLYQDKQGYIWIGTVDNGLLKFDSKTATYAHYQYDSENTSSISSNAVTQIYQDSEQNIWIATDNGLSIYNSTSNEFIQYKHIANSPYSLNSDYILTFFEDSNRMMWIGTFTGINRWDPKMTVFSQYSSQTNPELSNNNITSFTQLDNNKLIFSTYSGGLYQFSLNDNVFIPLEFNPYFSERRLMTVFGEKNTLWVGTRASGLFEIDLTTKKINHYQNDPKNNKSLSANSVTDIIRDSNGNLWVSTFHQGINRLNKDGSFTRFIKKEKSPEQGPSSNHILHVLEDGGGDIWLATYGGGLNRFDSKSETFHHIRYSDDNESSISSDLSWVMLLDKDNNLWVGNQETGIDILLNEKLLKKDYSFKHLDTKDGMKSRTVYAMEQDAFGDIWISSNKGISRFSPEKQAFKHFDLSHGLVDLEYSHGSVFKANNNTILFGSGKGATSVDAEKTNSYLPAPKVRLTNILNLNEPMMLKSSLSHLKSLELNYSDQLISFEYVGLNYFNPESTRYKYRLLGFDKEWIDAGKSRRATYTNLPAGNFQLQIIAGNNDDIWSDPGLALDITVKPAPWNTWWAYLFYTIMIALLLLAYSRFLNRKLLIEQQQKVYLKQQVQEKTQEYQSKNIELEQANKQLENAATVDKITGVKSRRYLDIYIEQASQLMSQIHENILPVQRSILPRLYLVMIKISDVSEVTNSQLVNLTDLLLYSRNKDDLVIRWSDDAFAIIGYEKDDNVRELAIRLSHRFEQVLGQNTQVDLAYSFYPFNFEQPMELSWDQVSVIAEHGLKIVNNNKEINWLGFYAPKTQPFSYLELIQVTNLEELNKSVKLKHG